jgi:hypothetical protein
MSSKNHINSVTIERAIDYSPDTSFLGDYTARANDGSIDRRNEMYVGDISRAESLIEPKHALGRSEYAYFTPYAGGEKYPSKDYKKSGIQDYNRMESLNAGAWCFVGIIAKAEIVVNGISQTITSGGIWGIESDSDKEKIQSIAKDELDNLRDTLLALGFGKRAIEYAIKKNNGEITDK